MTSEDSTTRRLQNAVIALRDAAAMNPNVAHLHAQLGDTLSKLGQLDEAAASFRRALVLDPSRPETYNDLGVVLMKLGAIDEAMTSYQTALRYRPDFPAAHNNVGVLLKMLGRYGDAKQPLGKAIALDPRFAHAHFNLGDCYYLEGDFDAALRCFEDALTYQPGFSPAKLSKSLIFLLLGNFVEGWQNYCPQNAQRPSGISFSAVTTPLSRVPSNLNVLLVKNQGIGDELFFSRFVPQLRARGACVTYMTERRTAEMFRRSGAFDEVIESGMPIPRADVTFLIEQLPLLLNMHHISQIPHSIEIPVLGRVRSSMETRLRSVGSVPRIGVTWRAGIARDHPTRLASVTNFLHKEIPLSDLARILRAWRGDIIVLQRDLLPGELDTLRSLSARPVHDFSDVSRDLEQLLALVSLLDDYVAVSNTNVHLRAAAGMRTRVLVPFPPEWRWMRSGTESPWFPGCRIYRQEANRDWSHALAQLQNDLEPARCP
jgi:Flp pilus assembly protein TadD